MKLSTNELIEKLKKNFPSGYEVSLRMGILTVTKDVFYKRKRFYLFSTDEFWNFSWDNGYTELEFKNNFENWIWFVDQTID
ncbi:hypothetical protein [Flavobacterium sp.]|uniref:hypothetical protein n=1 Tax=Flavobacterium sp. TaxID=239 RepID=UPI002604EA8E|nr:hypothetical protein [Flavobacterium sp.]